MNQDPLCGYYKPGVWWAPHVCVTCDLIAKVRQDMLAKCIHGLESLYQEMRNWSSDETEAVLAVYPELTTEQWIWAQRGVDRAMADLRALLDEQ
jgi:hypothetical protein